MRLDLYVLDLLLLCINEYYLFGESSLVCIQKKLVFWMDCVFTKASHAHPQCLLHITKGSFMLMPWSWLSWINHLSTIVWLQVLWEAGKQHNGGSSKKPWKGSRMKVWVLWLRLPGNWFPVPFQSSYSCSLKAFTLLISVTISKGQSWTVTPWYLLLFHACVCAG